jgi:hypothetical protein
MGEGGQAVTKRFYVTVMRETVSKPKVGWLLGPFVYHEHALGAVYAARKMAEEIDPRTVFDAFGTSSIELLDGQEFPIGVLNPHFEDWLIGKSAGVNMDFEKRPEHERSEEEQIQATCKESRDKST